MYCECAPLLARAQDFGRRPKSSLALRAQLAADNRADRSGCRYPNGRPDAMGEARLWSNYRPF